MKALKGIVCASITPMGAKGCVDHESMASLARYLKQNGINCIYPNGTNGESLSLSEEERKSIAEIVTREAGDKCTIYIQCGSADLEQTLRLIRHAHQVGADGVGVMTPAFFKCDQLALENYYDQICQEIQEDPIYLYNIPCCTGNDILPELFSKLKEKYANIQGIKFSASDMLRLRQYLQVTKHVLIGCDALVLDCLMAGGMGTVSGPCAAFPEAFVRLYRAFEAGDFEQARKNQQWIYQTTIALSGIPEIPAIKQVLKWRGIIKSETCRAPFRGLTREELARLEKACDDYAAQK